MPSKVNVFPWSLTATQKFDAAHDSAVNCVESDVCSAGRLDHADPLYENVLPARSIAAQSVVVGHDTRGAQSCSVAHARSTGTAADQVVPSKRNAFPLESSATHMAAVAHETDLRFRAPGIGRGDDQVPDDAASDIGAAAAAFPASVKPIRAIPRMTGRVVFVLIL
jgi:hypothetical protein